MAAAVRVSELLDGHVGLDIESLDRVYLNGYVPTLQVGGQVAGFMTRHLGYEIPSPAVMEKIGTSFRQAVRAFAAVTEGNRDPGGGAVAARWLRLATRGRPIGGGERPLRSRPLRQGPAHHGRARGRQCQHDFAGLPPPA